MRMNSEKVNDWLQIVGMFCIMASLVFVGVQVRQSQVIGEGESAMLSFEATIAAKQLYIDNIDVWIKGCAGEEMSVAEEATFAHLYTTFVQASFFGWLNAQHNILDLSPDNIIYGISANIHRYPGLARISLSHKAWAQHGLKEDDLESAREFSDAITARVIELRKIEPEPIYDLSFCGIM